jgi:hypothetical protein
MKRKGKPHASRGGAVMTTIHPGEAGCAQCPGVPLQKGRPVHAWCCGVRRCFECAVHHVMARTCKAAVEDLNAPIGHGARGRTDVAREARRRLEALVDRQKTGRGARS